MSAIDDITDEDQQKAIELGELIEAAEVDWLREALHAVVGVCVRYAGMLPNQIIEVLRYELAAFEPEEGDRS